MKQIILGRLLITLFVSLTFALETMGQTQININGPAGSGRFGTQVVVLPNGNIVVSDTEYNLPDGTANVGAVYLFNGANGAMISKLTGSTANDRIGTITVLTNGNFVVRSPQWSNGTIEFTGAVTFGDRATGVSGVVSAANSLIGSTADDEVGDYVTLLTNGNYVVGSPQWDNGSTANVGAATFGSGTVGVSGIVSAANSLIGSAADDQVGGNNTVKALPNGNYIVGNFRWDNGSIENAGAVTFGNGASGVSGVVSAANSLIGSTANDNIGNFTIILSNGNYVVGSSQWNNGSLADVGAATFGSGTVGVSGVVSAANSLIGSTANDRVGSSIIALTNGNYVVGSENWDNGSTANVGAATFGSGTTGITGAVSAANSLIGSIANDYVGRGATALSNGNYVVASPFWNNGSLTDVGAATFSSGTTGITGVVSTANSLIGSTANDNVGGSIALNNGNYVVRTLNWDSGSTVDVGAATFGNGASGTTGVVSAANSLIGSTANDRVGSSGIFALSNGNYLVTSGQWTNGTNQAAGAVTFGSGTTGITGAISASNSLVGTTPSENVSIVTLLTNGNYVISDPNWDSGSLTDVGAVIFGSGTTGVSGIPSAANALIGSTIDDRVGSVDALADGNYVVRSIIWNGANADVGAVTFGNGASGTTGAVSAANSLIGSTGGDQIGNGILRAFPNGSYAFISRLYDNGAIINAGAVTFGKANTGLTGTISSGNSVLGTASFGGNGLNFAYDATNNQLVVGRPSDNILTLFRPVSTTAASVSISGRVTDAGRGIKGAIVTLNDAMGNSRTTQTSSFGYFQFDDVAAGQTYFVNVRDKRFRFLPRAIFAGEDITDLNFSPEQ